MKNPREITLSNGTTLRIEGNMLWGFDNKFHPIDFTPAQRKILHKLAMNLNCPVSMIALYEAYADQGVQVDDKGISDNVAKVKNTIHDSVKSSVKSVRGYGYKLIGTQNHQIENNLSVHTDAMPISAKSPVESSGHFSDLTGDYYGFYLDSLGTKSILSTYIHIENAGTVACPQLTAYAVFGIRSNEVLMGDDLSQVFIGPAKDYHDAFTTFKHTLSDNGKRCSWLCGPICADGTIVNIQLQKNNSPEKWTILLDISEYLRCKRDRENESDFYRGGLGITLASRTVHGTFCFRLGLVRKSCINDEMIQNQEEMKERLNILDGSKDALWKPLKLSGWLDKIWYEWIMNE